jgi:hypothetical protein
MIKLIEELRLLLFTTSIVLSALVQSVC